MPWTRVWEPSEGPEIMAVWRYGRRTKAVEDTNTREKTAMLRRRGTNFNGLFRSATRIIGKASMT